MSHRFVRCPHCKMPHDASERVCPATGRRLDPAVVAPRSRMPEIPPPERRPEPLGFDPARNRIPDLPPAAGAPGTLPPTRNIARDLIGATVGGRYKVRGILGEGGMGTVYDAEHIGLGRFVAVKVLNPTQAKKRVAVKRFQQEARAAGAIGHPNICEVYDMGLLDDGSPYLVMEKLVGQTLADRISREGGLPFDELVDTMIQVLSGLIAAHDKAIIHRDIKPENVFLARRVGCPPIVKILDFGVSKMTAGFGGGDEQLDLTRTGMVMGTPYYMSPEQARGERNLDGRVDVYACGVMMYEALAGKRPFLAPNYNALLLAIINSNPVALRDIRPATPSALEAIVARAMAKSRDERYPSARHLLHDLQGLNLSRSGGNAAVRVPPPPTAEERARAPVIGGRASRREPPSATLRSRMSAPRESQEPATRLDIRAGRVPKGAESSGSIDISIDLNTETPVVDPRGRAPGGSDYVDEMPTEIFRPGMRVKAPAASRSEPAPRRNLAALVGDDWEGETVVHQPKPMLPPKQRRFNADETVVLHREGDPNETPLVRPRRPR